MKQQDGRDTGAGMIIDADYVVVEPQARAPREQVRKRPAPQPDGMAVLGPRGNQPAAKAQHGTPLFWATGLALVFMAFWAAGGHSLFRAAVEGSATTSELRIASFNSYVEPGERPTLIIDGEAVNGGKTAARLPPLEIEVTSGNGTTTRYKLGTAGALLAAGDYFPFSGRLDLPKHGVKTVTVAFVE